MAELALHHDWDLDQDPTAFVRASGQLKALDLAVEGAHCARCIAKIENGLKDQPGLKSARLNLSTGRLAILFSGDDVRARDYVRALRTLGYPASPYAPETETSAVSQEEKRLLRAMAVAGFATANVMLLSVSVWSGAGEMGEATQTLFHWISALIVLPTVAYSGRPFFGSAIRALKAKHVNMDVPISLAVFLACGLSLYETVIGKGHTYFDAAAMLLFFLLIGRYLDSRLRARAGQSARHLAAMQAAVAHRVESDGVISAIAARDVIPGDVLLVASGDKVPVDGQLLDPGAELDTSLVTGETVPRQAQTGEALYSGMVNLSHPFKMTATAAREDSLLAEITRLVEAGEQSRSRYVRLADRAANLYVPIVHTLAALTLVGWLVLTQDPRAAILNAIAVLLITCPCALALAVPAVQVVASGRLFKSGILIKSGDALERLAKADYAVFDKTGTLTRGKPRLINTEALPPDALELAAKLARTSRHPLSRAIADAAGMGDTADHLEEIAGGGLKGQIKGVAVAFGSASWMGVEEASSKDNEGFTQEAWLRYGHEAPVRFQFSDALRDDAQTALEGLRQRDFTLELLSGDRPHAAEAIADHLGLERWKGGLKPQDKIARIEALINEGYKPVMVGDGINDAPALAAAYVSISMGSASEVSRSAADLVIQGDHLARIPEAVDIARASQSRILENFALAALYNMIAIPLAVFGFVTPLVAAIAMSASSILVTLNALRLARK
ncbi:heavy metal translocating P-type ATPase [Woodsholea maritima]|uniref:heavy metal translocating P-type ATPase n=1 Tax=Woodsholea maritima TaxID=240237 RepID=UPI00038058EB|nr:heavy metal translocating P-type ATPase [Woodsholea maritima]